MKPAIEITDLSIGYRKGRKRSIVQSNVHLKALAGESIALIGPNGIGKSTLLKTIVGFQEAFSGEIKLHEKPIKFYSRRELSKLIGFVSTEIAYTNNLNAHELVSLGRHPHTNWLGAIGHRDKQIIENSMKQVGAGHLKNKYVSQLSDGERQRLMIARVLAQDTPIILLDEPTAFLDLPNKYDLFHILSGLAHRQGKTIILSSHDLNIALSEVDNVWLMYEDQVVEGAPEDLVLKNQLETFLKGSNVNFDPNEGAFKINRHPIRKIEVSGSGLEKIWTIRALERVGFEIVENEKLKLFCETKDCFTWRLVEKETGKSFDFNTIYELILYLKTKTN